MFRPNQSTPIYSLGALAMLLAFASVLILTDHADAGSGLAILTVLIANIPGVLAAMFSERTSRDIRNGAVVEKARQGSVEALADTGLVRESHSAVQEVRSQHDG